MEKKKKLRQKYSFLKVLTGSDLSMRRLPLMVADSNVKGPVVWLTACGHGEEVGGMVVIHEIFKYIKKKNCLKKGAIYAFPLMNTMGFENITRNVTISEEDLNRCFPGNPDGSLAERIAHIIFSTILKTGPDLVIDLHNDWVKSIPYVLLDRGSDIENKDVTAKTEEYARQSGFIVIRENDVIENTLTHSFLKEAVPALTFELGESYIVNEKNIMQGVSSILQVLNKLGMLDYPEDRFVFPVNEKFSEIILDYYDGPLCSSSGIIRFFVKPGDNVKEGMIIAKIFNTFGKLQENIRAKYDGIVLGHRDSSVAYPGISLVAFGIGDGDGDGPV